MSKNVNQNDVTAKGIKKQISLERVTKGQAATYLGVSVTSIQNYVNQGRLNPIKLGDTKQAKVFFSLDEILSLLKITDKEAFLSRVQNQKGE